MESISAADTTPCPPRPCIRICTLLRVVQLICRRENVEKTGMGEFAAIYRVLCPSSSSNEHATIFQLNQRDKVLVNEQGLIVRVVLYPPVVNLKTRCGAAMGLAVKQELTFVFNDARLIGCCTLNRFLRRIATAVQPQTPLGAGRMYS